MPLPPLTFTPILKQRAWGGNTLGEFGKSLPVGVKVGESWEIADLPKSIADGCSIVDRGPLVGRSLHALIEDDPEGMLGRAQPGPGVGFPLLVKLLDARENLSVQLHPSAAYAQANRQAHQKTEAWVVLAAEDGALVHVGLRDDVDRPAFEEALKNGALESLLMTMPVKTGDCVYLESGLCHALGAGIVVAEIQMPSDTTYRVWDWNRDDPQRPLHIREALESIRLGSEQHGAWPTITRGDETRTTSADGIDTALLVRSPSFTIERIAQADDAGTTVSFPFPTNDMPHVFLATDGEATIESGGESIRLEKGTTALLPAGSQDVHVHLEVRDNTRASLIHAVPPDPLDNVLA
jgi:mannose-6-phosphate isomerase